MTAPTADIHVLLIRLSALGDVVHTLPAVALLREKLPANAKLTWIVEAPFVELLQNNPVVDDVIVFPKKQISAELKNPFKLFSDNGELHKFVEDLRSRKFTAAIDFQGLFKSGAIAFLSGAPVRVGFAQARELSSSLITHKCHSGDYFANDKHVVDHNLELAEFFLRIAGGTIQKSDSIKFVLPDPGAETFSRMLEILQTPKGSNISEKDVETGYGDASTGGAGKSGGAGSAEPYVESPAVKSDPALHLQEPNLISQPPVKPLSRAISLPPVEADTEQAIAKRRKSGEKLIVLIPGTTWITKIWPKEKWSQLVSQLVHLNNVRIVLIGGPSETEMNRYIYDSVLKERPNTTNLIDITGKTRLSDLIALFKMADIVAGADTGPLHIAAATGMPAVIGIFGSTPWRRNGPLGNDALVVALDLSCQPCFEKRCPLKTLACLSDLDVASVFNEIKNALARVQLAK